MGIAYPAGGEGYYNGSWQGSLSTDRESRHDGGWDETRITRKDPECNKPVFVGEECASKIPQLCVLVKEDDDTAFYRKNMRVSARLVTMETSEYGEEGVRASATQNVVQIKCIYNNACSIGNKQKKLEAIVQLPSQKRGGMTHLEYCD